MGSTGRTSPGDAHCDRGHWGNGADHFFTSLPLRLRGDARQEEHDWALVAATIGVPAGRLLRLKQVHGRKVVVVREGEARAAACTWPEPEADIILSDDPGVALAVQVADCVPLLIADRSVARGCGGPRRMAGTAANVAATAVDALDREFGSRPEDLRRRARAEHRVLLLRGGRRTGGGVPARRFGPTIDRWFSRDERGGLRLDLWAANRDQLLASGVAGPNIHQSGLCTSSHRQWFASYRRDGKGTGRIAGVIRARP